MPIREAGAGARVRAAAAIPAVMLLAITLPANASGADGHDVFKRMVALYANAKSYSGTFTQTQTGKAADGKTAVVSMTMHIKYKSPNLFSMDKLVTGTAAAFKTGPVHELVISDGHFVYDYIPTKKLYRKQPIPSAVPLFRLLPGVGMQSMTTFTVRSSASVAGRQAYLLAGKVTVPANMPPQQAAMLKHAKPPELAIDRQNYELLRVTATGAAGSAYIRLAGQSINPGIATSTFNWSPPPGVHEAPQPPTQGGAPGR